MKSVRLLVNWGLVLLSPLWVIPMLVYSTIRECRSGHVESLKLFRHGEKFVWQ